MTGYAYDLGIRQSARVLEHAMRVQATVWAESIGQSEIRSFSGQISAVDKETVWVKISVKSPDLGDLVPGQYYQLVICLDENRYLTVCDLLESQGGEEGPVLVFSRPKSLQVMQRRRFARCSPGHAYPVQISWETTDEEVRTPVLGQIHDLSLHGLSVRVPDAMDSHLYIGDTVYVRFTLTVREPEYFTAAVICHKELQQESSELTVGLQFVQDRENEAFHTRLRSALIREGSLKKGT
jgi:c-di-GMP-binding flagellar brake protein YcgR